MRTSLFLFFAAALGAGACARGHATGESTAHPQERPSKYAVVVSQETQEAEGWSKVVKALKEKHGAKVFAYEDDLAEVSEALKAFFPKYVCVVARPEELRSNTLAVGTSRLLRQLDDDPYEDALWGIVTGYDAGDALRMATAEPLVVNRGLSHVGGGWLDWFDQGVSFCEGEKNAKYVKASGAPVQRVRGPDDTTREFIEVLNGNDRHIVSTSGHATTEDWQMGYSYESGQIRSKGGKLYGLDTQGNRHEIKTDNAKLYYSPGNCLIARVPHRDCMALAWIHNGANQFFGHIVLQGRPCYAWAIADYFFALQGRFTYAESVYVHWLALQFEISVLGKTYPCCTRRGKGTVLYGDPAWEARMKKVAEPLYEQELTCRPADGKLDITFRIVANREAAVARPPVALLPMRIRNAKVESSDAKKAIVADNFILMHVWEENDPPLKKGEQRTVRVSAEACGE